MSATINYHPDALLLNAWRDAQAADQLRDESSESEEADAVHIANWSRAYATVSTVPALTLEGLAVKVRALALDVIEGRTDYSDELARTTIEAVERLAIGRTA